MDKIRTMLLGALLCVSTGTYANELKIGFVSTERLFREAAPAVRALKKLEKEFARGTPNCRSWSSRRRICRPSWKRKP